MVDAGLIAAPTDAPRTPTTSTRSCSARATPAGWRTSSAATAWPDPVPAGDPSGRRSSTGSRRPAAAAATCPTSTTQATSDDRLTPTQYAHMQRWKDNERPTPTTGPDRRRRRPRSRPAGWTAPRSRPASAARSSRASRPAGLAANARPIVDPANYVEAVPALASPPCRPGDITARRWRCRGRPTSGVRGQLVAGAAPQRRQPRRQSRARTGPRRRRQRRRHGRQVEHARLRRASRDREYVEVERCDTASITLLTPHLDFRDVPQGPMGMVREAAARDHLRGHLARRRSHARVRARRRAGPPAARRLQHVGHGRTDRGERSRRPACGSSTAPRPRAPCCHHRRVTVREPGTTRQLERSRSSATPSPARPRQPRWSSIAPAACPRIAATGRPNTSRCSRRPRSSWT